MTEKIIAVLLLLLIGGTTLYVIYQSIIQYLLQNLFKNR
ncbi:MAG: hypothetical protein XD50_0021 [Clostridia bacterium 41_269]|nr:MAG: hypothetical protein XD50_0021 [Clostridia bacterium 41_269]